MVTAMMCPDKHGQSTLVSDYAALQLGALTIGSLPENLANVLCFVAC